MFKILIIIFVFTLIVSRINKKSEREANFAKSLERMAKKEKKRALKISQKEEKVEKIKAQQSKAETPKKATRKSEWLRKKIVYVKRNPSIIPLIFMVISCLLFNLNLEDYSRTTLALLMDSMGLTLFAISLFSYLSIVTYLSAYPKRQKPSYVKIILAILMIAGSIILELYYYHLIIEKTEIGPAIIQITADKQFIVAAKQYSIIHVILLSVTLLLMLTLPIYSKWIKKINTTVQLEESQVNNVQVEEDIE